MNSFLTYIFSLLFIVGAVSCFDLPEGHNGSGMRPIYIDPDDFSYIYSTTPKANVDQGSVALDDGFFYVNERFKGIHVYDNSNPNDPKKIYFWNIPGNTEFSVDGKFLYADNSRHLITIDISDKAAIKYVSHVKDVYTGDNQNKTFPEDYIGFFECVDFEKGIVVDWEIATLEDANCSIP